MRRYLLALIGLTVLAGAWAGPLPAMAGTTFYAHMAMHVAVVAVAAPLLALSIADTALDPLCHWPRAIAPLPSSALDLVVIWAWHAPALHHASQHNGAMMALEQSSFLLCSLAVWLAAFGGSAGRSDERALAGSGGLLMTSMHMTLLGALLALSTRPIYGHSASGDARLSALEDQHLGGLLMLLGAGTSYLLGALILFAGLLRRRGLTA